MSSPKQRVQEILSSWKGSDAANEATPQEVAGEIDHVYQEYRDGLPAITAAIKAGQDENERRVA